MIRTEHEYEYTKQRIEQWKRQRDEELQRLQREGYTVEEINRVLNPQTSFFLGWEEEVAEYERRNLQKGSG